MDSTKKKGKIVPVFKNLGFIIPKKKKSKNAVRGGDGSSTEDSPNIADDSSDSSTASSANVSDLSNTSVTGKNKEESSTSANAKSALEVKKPKNKLDFKKPFSSIFKSHIKKTSETTTPDTVEKDAKRITKPSEKKVVGTPLSDEQYEDIFNSVSLLVSQMESPTETETLLNDSLTVSTSDLTDIDPPLKTDPDIIPNSIDGASGIEKSNNKNANIVKKQPVFAKSTAVPKRSPGFKNVFTKKNSNIAEKKRESEEMQTAVPKSSGLKKVLTKKNSNIAEKKESKEKEVAEKLAGPNMYTKVLITPSDYTSIESNSSSTDAKKFETSENKNDLKKKSSESVDEKKSSVASEKNVTTVQNLDTTSVPSKSLERPSVPKPNKPSSFAVGKKKQGKPKGGSKLIESKAKPIDVSNKPSSFVVSKKKQGQPKGGSKLVELETSTLSLSKEKQTPSESSYQTANDSSTIDVYDVGENVESETRHYLNTQTTKWGRDRSIIYDKPPNAKNYKEQMLYLRKCRNIGLWVKCCNKDCGKYRYCQDLKDPLQVPDVWTCSMNSDTEFNNCLQPEQRQPWEVDEEVDVISSKYTAGSIVWAYVQGHPWWPAMVDDDPNIEMFYWMDNPASSTPNWYHVVFLDQKVSRAWVTDRCIEPYSPNDNYRSQHTNINKKDKVIVARLKAAREDATRALSMPVLERLNKFGFISRFNGPIRKPTLEIDSSSEDDSSQRSLSHSTKTATSSLSRSSTHGQRETRKRKQLSKLKRSLKRQKVATKYLTRTPMHYARQKTESEIEEEEEEEEEEVDSESENMQIDGREEHDLQEIIDEGEEVNDETDEDREVNNEKENDDAMEVNEVESVIEVSEQEENSDVDIETVDENENSTTHTSTQFQNKKSEIEKTIKSKPFSPQKAGSSVGERNSSSTFFNDCPQATMIDDGEQVDERSKSSVKDIDERPESPIDSSDSDTDVDVELNDDPPQVNDSTMSANDNDGSDGEWSDRSIISDVDSNATKNVDETTSSTIDLVSTSDGGDVSENDDRANVAQIMVEFSGNSSCNEEEKDKVEEEMENLYTGTP